MDSPFEYNEISVCVSGILLIAGMSIWIGNYFLPIFTNWMWAIGYGFVFIGLGYLFMFSDFRIYVGNKTVTEEFLSADDERRDAR